MEILMRVLQTALPVFLTIGIGALCRRMKLFSREGMAALKNAAVNICLPAVMFAALATADYSPQRLTVPVIIFAVCVVMLLMGMGAKRITRSSNWLSPYLMTAFEAGMLGYGLFALLFPNVSTSEFAIIDLGQVLFVFTLYKILLCRKSGSGSVVKDALTSPVLWAIVLGFIVGVSGLWNGMKQVGIADIATSVTDFLSAPTSVLILLSIGYDLVPSEIRWKSVALFVAERVVIAGAALGVLLLINRTLLGGIMHTGALTLMFILPPPYVLPMFVDSEDERANISSALSVLTLLTLVIFAVMAAIW